MVFMASFLPAARAGKAVGDDFVTQRSTGR